jgi:hypothetical protein
VDTLPPPSTDRVDRLYHQLGKILTITVAQQEECSCRRQVGDSTSSPVRSRADWWKAAAKPSVAGTTPSLARVSPQGLPWQQCQHAEL